MYMHAAATNPKSFIYKALDLPSTMHRLSSCQMSRVCVRIHTDASRCPYTLYKASRPTSSRRGPQQEGLSPYGSLQSPPFSRNLLPYTCLMKAFMRPLIRPYPHEAMEALYANIIDVPMKPYKASLLKEASEKKTSLRRTLYGSLRTLYGSLIKLQRAFKEAYKSLHKQSYYGH
jgi:hypothetical protein